MPISKVVLDNQSKENVDLDGQYVRVPHGTTAQRPSSPAGGHLRFNTDLGTLEQYNTSTNSWQAIDSPPIITSLAYAGSLTGADPAGSETITLTGTNFKAGASVTVGGTTAPSVSVVSSTSITFTTPAKTAADYDVKVTNANGLAATLSNGISYNGVPAFSTAAGNVGSIAEDVAMSTITIVAAEPDGGALAFSVTSGALPTGVSMSSAGAITGTPNVNVTSDTTYNFTVTATDDENQTNARAFNLIVLRPIYATVLNNSARFDDNKIAFLTRTPSSASNRRTWTWSGWVKRANIETFESIFAAQSSGSNRVRINFGTNHEIQVYGEYTGGSSNSINLQTNAKFRDPSGWLHIVLSFDTTQATASNRAKLYVNGTLQTLSTATYPAQNDQLEVNTANAHFIGQKGDNSEYLDGYLSDVYFIDGQALTPTSFAEEYYGVWAPKVYSGSYGTNGFHLDFETDSQDSSGNNNHWIPNSLGGSLVKYSGSSLVYPNNLYKILDGDNSTSASIQGSNTSTSASFIYTPATPITVSSSLKFKYSTGQTNCKYKINGGSYVNLGSSGTVDFNTGFTGTLTSIEWYVANSNSLISIYDLRVNDVQVINYDIGYDDVPDSPTNNFATLNPVDKYNTGATLSGGNLKWTIGGADGASRSTSVMTSGKWYVEFLSNNDYIGVASGNASIVNMSGTQTVYYAQDGTKRVNASGSSYGASYADGDIIGIALDLDASTQTVTFYKNNASQGSINLTDVGNEGYSVSCGSGSGSTNATANFGQDSSFAGAKTAQNNADGNGKGDFFYAPPTGYLALCANNLPESSMNTSLDDRPEDYFTPVLYTGNGGSPGTQSINTSFRPDFVWLKSRTQTYTNYLFNSLSGNNKHLISDVNNGEATLNGTSDGFTFESTGFQVLATGGSALNESGQGANNMAGWAWRAGGAPSASNSNTSGAMTANSVSLNGALQSSYTPAGSPSKYPTKMSINTKAGFSIVSWTGGGGSAETLPHGLSSTPDMMILKGLDSRVWATYHKDQANATHYLKISTDQAQSSDATMFYNAAPDSNKFTVGSYNTVNAVNYVGFFWHDVPGYSKFGKYIGTGDPDGAFVSCGFKPSMVMVKSLSTGSWFILDRLRNPHNEVVEELKWDTNAIQITNSNFMDFTANGFKLRTSGGAVNAAGQSYIFMAFAEDPYKYTEAR